MHIGTQTAADDQRLMDRGQGPIRVQSQGCHRLKQQDTIPQYSYLKRCYSTLNVFESLLTKLFIHKDSSG